MRKQILAILVATAMACAFAPIVAADNTETIEVTLSPNTSANITCNKTAWAPGCGIGGTNQTSTTWGDLDNSGTVAVSVTIVGEDTAAWAINNTAAGHNIFYAEYNPASAGWNGYDDNAETFDANIAYNEHVVFGLGIGMPTSTSVSATQSYTITFVATAL
jgi:hypothetical protein